MKKAAIILLGLSMSMNVLAQRSAIQSAENYLRDKDFAHANEYIEKAVNDPSTAKDPKAWYVRGNIYMNMQADDKLKSTNPYKEAAASYLKVVEYKADYQKDEINSMLVNCLFLYFNDGVSAYNSAKYDEAYSLMRDAAKISSLDNGKRFSKEKYAKTVDTVAAQSKNIAAMSAYISKKYDEALPLLIEAKNNPITKKASIYSSIAEIYQMQHKDAEFIAIIDEAKAAYPNDMTISVREINYFLNAGKQAELIKKLEESIAKFPDNTGILATLASTYAQLATKGDAKDKPEMLKKSQATYAKLLKIAPDTPIYNYNAGVLYYDQAVDINTDMNAITGSTAADNKKFNDLKVERDAMFSAALPYFERSYNVLTARASLTSEDKSTLHDTMIALREIYAKTDKLDKATEMKKKLEAGN